jgi:hypothetical protein
MGRRIVSEVQLPPPRATRLIERLAQPASYVNGRNGCISMDSVGLRITRAGEHLDLVENCGHLFLTPDGWDGEMAVFSEEMALELQSLVERFL